MKLTIDQDQLAAEIEEMATISEAEPPVVTRVVFSEADLRARAWVTRRCEEVGLRVRQDAIGNLFARWDGSDASAAAVGTGSHIDAIPNAGKFDGVVGVLGGLEAVRALKRAGFAPKHSIELLIFATEEPTRFGIGCLGSRMLVGVLSAEKARLLKDGNGETLEDVRRSAGMTGPLEKVRLGPGYYKGFLELHIEQGPLLERENLAIGIVTKIAAPASARIFIEGAGGHAGGVLMPDRKDALCAAAEIVLAVEGAARGTGAVDTVATVGICNVFPGAVNSIPSRVELSLDVRDTELARRDSVLAAIERAVRTVCAKRGVTARTEMLNADAPAECATSVIDVVTTACDERKIAYRKMVSRAYHDSLFMARIAPTGMVFIPCRNGYSHRPDEYASPEHIAQGALVLTEALAKLAA